MSLLQDNIHQAQAVLQELSALEPALARAAAMVIACLRSGGKLLLCGNGGSATDAAHLATEFIVRYQEDRPPYAAIALTESGGVMTAMGNDYHFEQTFARQVWGLGRPEDVLIVFSTSGKSDNIKLALKQAKKSGMKAIAFLGKGGADTLGMADVDLLVPGTQSTARIQEAHKLLYHTLCEMVERELRPQE